MIGWDISTPEGRRAWAFVTIWGGCLIFTVFAAVGVWLVSRNELYTLILALAAHVQLLIGMGAFSFVLGRRMVVRVTRDGAEISDVDARTLRKVADTVTEKARGSDTAPAEGDVTEKDLSQ